MKQRVLIVNKFYYRRGGDCVCTLNLEELLKRHGHETAVFAMQYPENLPSEWSDHWPEEIDFSGGAAAKIKAVGRSLGLGEVKSKFKGLLMKFKPDVVHLNNIHSYLSPVLATLAHEAGARVVWTLHDYKLLCPSYSCLDSKGNVCERCFTHKLPVLTTRCMKGSLAASAVAWMEALRWNRKRLQRNVDMFICPSAFMQRKMSEGEFDAKKLTTLCNFVDPEMIDAYRNSPAKGDREDYYCYVGRLSEEKGVRTLLATASELPYKLLVAGGGPLSDELKAQYKTCTNIEFLGHVNGEKVRSLLSKARFSIIPSECYENNPLGVIESLCAGTPVVGAAIGGIPELVGGNNGRTFEPGNGQSMAQAIEHQWAACVNNDRIRAAALEAYSPETHYTKLMEIYRNCPHIQDKR